MKCHPLPRIRPRGFSLIELLVVAALCAVVFSAGAITIRAVATNQRRVSTFQQVSLTSAVAGNFFPGTTATSVDSYTAPNAGRFTLADTLRNQFYEDVAKSSAVFCLPRTGNVNTVRPTVIDTSPLGTFLPASVDTPAAFLGLLNSLSATSTGAAVFRSYRGAPDDSYTVGSNSVPCTNGSIFLLYPSGSPTEIWVRAIYEIDYVQSDTDVYACVRRYNGSALTTYYDVVYPNSTLPMVGIPFSHFERSIRTNISETTAIDRFKKADNMPFYLVWWPDPGQGSLQGTAVGTYATSTPQNAYAKHEGQTSFGLVVPQFPPL